MSFKELEKSFDDYYRIPGNEHLKPLRNIVLAQCRLESNHGKSELFTEFNNACGMKYRAKLSNNFPKWEFYIDHQKKKDRYFKLSDISDFPYLYWAFIGRWPYVGWEQYIDSPFDYLWHISQKYCGSDSQQVYYDKVKGIYEDYYKEAKNMNLNKLWLEIRNKVVNPILLGSAIRVAAGDKVRLSDIENNLADGARKLVADLVWIKISGKPQEVSRETRDLLRSNKAEITGLKSELKELGNINKELQSELAKAYGVVEIPTAYDFESF